ncbi:MAG TPA: S1 RNA-binding domain-containing protein [Candidatus Nanoarchaeia archaeon]|nr:S1 RNA-binding domain-containing protein [Candidatus Nanoarchaeia archaeon]
MYKKKGFPQEQELVLCTVTKVLPNSIFVTLDEYENKEGLIHISEIAPGRIRNIRDYVIESKKIVCKILMVNKDRNQIDLSLRRVTLQQKLSKEGELKEEKAAEKLLEAVAKNAKIDLKKLYDSAGIKIIEKYGSLFKGFQEVVVKGDIVLIEAGMDKKVAAAIATIVKERIKPPEVKINEILNIHNSAENGIELIKDTLIKTKELASKNKYDLKVHYLGSPRFQFVITSTDYKTAEKSLDVLNKFVTDESKKNKSEIEFTREK